MCLREECLVSAVPWGRGIFPALVILFLLVRLGEATGTAPGWLRHYGDDFLCLPLVLGLTLTVHRLAAGSKVVLPVSHGLAALTLFTLFFEVFLPRTGAAAVADPLDALMYLAGFLVFQVFLNRGVADQGDHADIPGRKFDIPARTH